MILTCFSYTIRPCGFIGLIARSTRTEVPLPNVNPGKRNVDVDDGLGLWGELSSGRQHSVVWPYEDIFVIAPKIVYRYFMNKGDGHDVLSRINGDVQEAPLYYHS
jgi:hypothetical protein